MEDQEKKYRGVLITASQYVAARSLINVIKEQHYPVESEYKTPKQCKCLKLISRCKEYQSLQVLNSLIDENEKLKIVDYNDIPQDK